MTDKDSETSGLPFFSKPNNEFLRDGITLSGYHIQQGVRSFMPYCIVMIEELGEEAKPYLKQWYNSVREDPISKSFAYEMDSYSYVQNFNLSNLFDKSNIKKRDSEFEPNNLTDVIENTDLTPIVRKNIKKDPSLKTLHLNIGYVYVMTNTFIPNMVKIGMTTKTPEERAVELRSTGVPGDWIPIHSMFVPNCEVLEKFIHKKLSDSRVSNDREFFSIKVSSAIEIVNQYSNEMISYFLDWPNSQSVRNFVDVEAEKLKDEIEKQAKKIHNERQLKLLEYRNQKKLREIEYRKEEEEREKQRLQQIEQTKIDNNKMIDIQTRETLNENNFGWMGLVAGCLCFYFLTRVEEATKFQFLFWGFAIITFMIYRDNVKDKKEAREQRKRNGLPDL